MRRWSLSYFSVSGNCNWGCCVVALNGLLCWDFSPINESHGSLRVLVPVAVSCHNDSLGVVFAV